MGTISRKLSLFVIIAMLIQLIAPTASVFAAAPSAPAGFTAKLTSPSDVLLQWGSVAGAAAYRVYDLTSGSRVLSFETTSAIASLSKMKEGTYVYGVTAVNAGGESPVSGTATFTVTYPKMQAPASITHTIANGNDVTVRWADSTYAQSYNLYKIMNGEKILVANTTSLYRNIPNAPEGSVTYAVSAVHSLYGESPISAPYDVAVIYPKMQVPKNPGYFVQNGNDIVLRWDLATYATGYKVYKVASGVRTFLAEVQSNVFSLPNSPEGEYSFEVTSNSARFGESAEAAKISFSLVHPLLATPANLASSTVNGNDLVLRWSTVQFANTYKLYQNKGGVRSLLMPLTSPSTVLSNLPEGTYSYEVTAVSDRFGESPVPATLEVKLVHPVMQPPSKTYTSITKGNDLYVSWENAPFASGYNLYKIVGDKREFLQLINGAGKSFPNMPQGDYTYEITSYSDRFGESASGTRASASIVWPTMLPPTNFKVTVQNFTDVMFKWDSMPYATSYNLYRVNGTEKTKILSTPSNVMVISKMAQGDYTFEVHSVSDRFGESSEGSVQSVYVGYPPMTPPYITLYQPTWNSADVTWVSVPNAQKYNVYRVVNGAPTLVTSTTTPSFRLPSVDRSKDYELYVTSFNSLNGESLPSNKVTIFADLVAPETTTTLTQEWYNYNQTVSLNARDSLTGVDKTYYSLNDAPFAAGNTFEVSAEGRHVVTYYSVDKQGNVEEKKSKAFGIDKTKPTVATDFTYGATTISFTAADDLSGVKAIYYEINGGQPVQGDRVTLGAADKTIKVYSYDNANNKSEEIVIVTDADIKPPVTKSNIPAGWSKDDVAVTLTATDDISGVDKTYYSLDGAPFVEGSSFTVSKEGMTKVRYYSVDKQGNFEVAKSEQVSIDRTKPSTEGNFTDEWIREDFKGALRGLDDHSGVAESYYSINGGEFAAGDAFTIKEEGIHTVKFYSVDGVGHIGDTVTGEVRIDKTAPVTQYVIGKKAEAAGLPVTLFATDDRSGVKKTMYSVNGGELTEGTTFHVNASGSYKIVFYSVDVAGNVEASQTAELTIDTTAPVTSSNIGDKWVNGKNKDFKVQLMPTDDLSGVDKTFYTFGDGPEIEGTTIEVEADGIYPVSYYSIDKAGNVETAKSQELKVDRTAPVTTSSVRDGSVLHTFEVDLAATDNLSGVVKTQFSINGGDLQEGTKINFGGAGLFTLAFYSEDAAGNREETRTISVMVDLVPPTTTSNLDSIGWVNTDLPIVLKAEDDLSGVDKTFYAVNGSEYNFEAPTSLTEEGTHQVSYYSVDKAGNVEEKHEVSVSIDKTKPVTVSSLDGGFAQPGVEVKLTATDNLSGVDKTFVRVNGEEKNEASFPLNEEGVYLIEYYSVDVAGNVEDKHSFTLTVDRTAPVTETNLEDKWYIGEVAVQLSATDNLSGVDKTYYGTDGAPLVEGDKFFLRGEGVRKVEFYSIDKAGNVENKHEQTVKIDSTAPVTEANLDGIFAVKPGFEVKLAPTDNLSGVKTTYYTVNGAAGEGTSFQLDMIGPTTVTYYSVDVAGNVEAVHTYEIVVDTTAPVTSSNLKDQWYTEDVSVVLTATDDLSGVDKTYYSVNGSEFQEGSEFLLTEEGEHKVAFYSVDKAGNIEAKQEATLKIDKTAPVTGSNLEGVKAVQPGFEVKLAPTDNLSGVKTTFYTVNGVAGEGTSFSLKQTGSYEIVYYSVDNAGNVEAAHTFKLVADEAPPVTLSDVQDIWYKQNTPVVLTATDDLSGVDKTFYSVDGKPALEGTTFTVIGEGIHKLTYNSVDVAGNVEVLNVKELKIDMTPPVVNLNVQEGAVVIGNEGDVKGKDKRRDGDRGTTVKTALLAYTATDNLSGIASQSLTLNGKPVENGATVSFPEPGTYTIIATATDKAGWTTTVTKTIIVEAPKPITATMEVTPKVITGNKGIFTVRLTLPSGVPYNFDLSTVKLNGVSPRLDKGNPSGQSEIGMFKFERSDFQWNTSEVTLVLTGMVNGIPFSAQKTVKVNVK